VRTLVNETGRPRVVIETLGCKLNQAESELLAAELIGKGYQIVQPGDGCHIYVLNTCTVTHIADRKARHLLRMARRQNPQAYIIATGCFAERAPSEIKRLDGVDLIAGNREKEDLPAAIEKIRRLQDYKITKIEQAAQGISVWRRTRAMVKIQDGCSQRCAYCIVPLVRGGEKSIDPALVLPQVNRLVAQGYKEIVLTGTEIGAYQYNDTRLKQLLQLILEKTSVERLRLTSLQPQEITPELLSLWQSPRLCRHVHLPLQSGSDTILHLMKRRYDADTFKKAVNLLREAIPDVAITTDIIVGFPGEGTAEFAETEKICKDIGFARTHLFPFSPRPGTAAALMPKAVDVWTKKRRFSGLQEISLESSKKFKESFLGKVLPVLWERPVKGTTNLWSGLTDNYIRVFVRTDRQLHNEVIPTRLVKIEGDAVWGELQGHFQMHFR
jgi:threonylcarbamoyladenosine tRNA methylthiotransferase MtaB